MVQAPPGQSKLICWLQAGAFSVVIFVSIPFARALQKLLDEHASRSVFHYLVVAAVVVGLVLSVRGLRGVKLSAARIVWLVAVSGTFVAYAFALDSSPEEAFHFVEYGLLGILIFRALTHHVRDHGIYIAAFFLGAAVGVLDEGLQWITPDRVWDIRDIWLNAVAVVLTQVGIAFGIAPSYIRGWPNPQSIRWMARSAAGALLLLGLSLLNTPERIQAYSAVIPGLESLGDGKRLMMQYGHLYEDPEIGVFRSRFSPEALAEVDRTRAKEHAAILDRYATGEDYGAFLQKYTASKAPFVHELRVHLFRRNHHLRETQRYPDDKEIVRRSMTIAYRENQIVEKYFPHTLGASGARIAEDKARSIRAQADLNKPYESPVSHRLFTQVTETQIRYGLLTMLLLLFVLDRRQARRTDRPVPPP